MRARTIKPIAALAITGMGTALVVSFRTAAPGLATSGVTALTSSAGVTVAPAPAATGPTDAPDGSSGATRTSQQPYADGTWVGDTAEEPWGTFQVAAVIQDGQLVDVRYSGPGDRHSSRINREAVPILTEEAVAAQSADIDLLGGATWTSESYTASLQAALDAAKAAVTRG